MIPSYVDLTPARQRYKQACINLGLTVDLRLISFLVSKTDRTLSILQNGQTVMQIPVIIGRDPVGHKQTEGDLKTPEGNYRICYFNPDSRFHLFLGLNYPNANDAQQAWQGRRLSTEEYEALLRADHTGMCPNWYTTLGGEVGIHGGGIEREGTAGCIAMANTDIELVWSVALYGTTVGIRR